MCVKSSNYTMLVKRFVNFIVLFFLLGTGLLSFLLILSGARHSGTLKNFYWFQAETSGFNDAPNTTRWYNYDYCNWEGGQNRGCSSKAPAKPFSPRDNFGRSDNMPSTFLDNRNTYYYLSRVAWAMLLIAIFFVFMVIFSLFVMFFKNFTVLAGIITASSWMALFFMTLSACLYTGCYVKARNAFHHDNRHAKLGAKNFGLIWTNVFLLLITTMWSTFMLITHKREKREPVYDRYSADGTELYATYPTSNNTTGNYEKSTTASGTAYPSDSDTNNNESRKGYATNHQQQAGLPPQEYTTTNTENVAALNQNSAQQPTNLDPNNTVFTSLKTKDRTTQARYNDSNEPVRQAYNETFNVKSVHPQHRSEH